MSTWKSKLFGDNAMNFWGWNIAGLAVVGASLIVLLAAIIIGIRTSTDCLLLAIYLVAMGQFGLSLANYLARVSEKLDAKKPPTD